VYAAKHIRCRQVHLPLCYHDVCDNRILRRCRCLPASTMGPPLLPSEQ
jgi:hypothetical protein